MLSLSCRLSPGAGGLGVWGESGKAGPHAVSWASRGFSFLIYTTKWLSPRSCLWHPASAQSTGLHPCVFPAVTALFFDQWEHTTCLGLDEKLSPQASTGQHLTRASWGHKKKTVRNSSSAPVSEVWQRRKTRPKGIN